MTPLSSENQTRTANHLEEREGPGVSCPEDQKGSVSTEKLNLPSLQKIKPSYEAKTDPPHLLVFFFHLKG